MATCVIGPTDGLTRQCSSPRSPPLPPWNVSRAEFVELSRDVHDAYVESSIAQAKSIEPLSLVGNGIDPHRFANCARMERRVDTSGLKLVMIMMILGWA